jgi:3-oxoadipate enol-lactonase
MVQGTAGRARAKDGCLLFYRMHSQPGKPRLVLVHSLALDAGIWVGVVDNVGEDFEILVYDCRGHGQSERRPGPYTAQLFASDLAAVLDHCGWSSAVIAGCSMGGCVAQAFAAEFADRARGLALIDTTAWYGPTAQEDWRKRAAKAAEEGFRTMLPFQLSRWFGDDFCAAQADLADAVTCSWPTMWLAIKRHAHCWGIWTCEAQSARFASRCLSSSANRTTPRRWPWRKPCRA